MTSLRWDSGSKPARHAFPAELSVTIERSRGAEPLRQDKMFSAHGGPPLALQLPARRGLRRFVSGVRFALLPLRELQANQRRCHHLDAGSGQLTPFHQAGLTSAATLNLSTPHLERIVFKNPTSFPYPASTRPKTTRQISAASSKQWQTGQSFTNGWWTRASGIRAWIRLTTSGPP